MGRYTPIILIFVLGKFCVAWERYHCCMVQWYFCKLCKCIYTWIRFVCGFIGNDIFAFGCYNWVLVMCISTMGMDIICKLDVMLKVWISVAFTSFIHVVYIEIECRRIICFNVGCNFVLILTVSADWLICLCGQMWGTGGKYLLSSLGALFTEC